MTGQNGNWCAAALLELGHRSRSRCAAPLLWAPTDASLGLLQVSCALCRFSDAVGNLQCLALGLHQLARVLSQFAQYQQAFFDSSQGNALIMCFRPIVFSLSHSLSHSLTLSLSYSLTLWRWAHNL